VFTPHPTSRDANSSNNSSSVGLGGVARDNTSEVVSFFVDASGLDLSAISANEVLRYELLNAD